MNERLRALYDEKGRIWARMEAIIAADLTDESRQEYERMEADLERVEGDIRRVSDHDRRTAEFANRGAGDGDTETRGDNAETRRRRAAGDGETSDEERSREERAHEAAFGAWLRRGINGISSEYREILESRAVALTDEQRAASAIDGVAGGFMVPNAWRDRVTVAMAATGRIADSFEQLNTDTGQPLPWPTADDTANEGEIIGENQDHDSPAATDLSFGQRMVGSFMISSRVIKVPLQLTRDTGGAMDAFVQRRLGERLGRTRNRHATLGTGAGQPEGIVNFAVGRTGANGQTTSIIWEDLVDLVHSVDPAYRDSGRCQFTLNDATIGSIRKLKGSDGHPVWIPGLVAGEPDRILTYPYQYNQHIPVMAASAKTIAFGDFLAGMVWRNVGGMTVLRLTERYAEKLQVGILAFASWDCGIQDSKAVRWYQNSAV